MYRFIVNPGSGSGGGRKIESLIVSEMKDTGIDYEICETQYKGHAKELARSFDGERIIAVGGDGTFHEVLNGINTEKCALGFIPCGRGNDFAAGFELPKKPTETIKIALYGNPVNIDYIAVGENLRCLNIAGTGLDVDVVKGVEDKKDSKFTYLMSLIHCIYHFTPYELDVTSDGVSTHYSCLMVGVCNGKQFGGGIKISPLSSFTSGKLNVIAMEMPQNRRIMRALMNFSVGNHMSKPYTHHFECESVCVSSPYNYPLELDGEIYENTVLDCRVVKGGLKTFK